MVRIRLRRVGRKKQPSYRIVVTDKRSPRDGRYIEIIGFYNPRTRPDTMELQEDRALHWLSVGAQPSEAVERIFKTLGTMDRYARLKQGEDLEKLLAEATAAAEARETVSPKTEYAPMSKEAKEAMKAARAEAAAEASVKETVVKATEPEASEESEDVAATEEATEAIAEEAEESDD
ncbi:MAG: 30S ribosomal protein S16 [Anaerolineae bacterium]|nr:30S ribosomal protein S16 [Anaerolineae bacterium]